MTAVPSGYLPHPARIADLRDESPDTRTFCLVPVHLRAEAAFAAAEPGQFAMLSVLGFGEAAFTISEIHVRAGRSQIELTVRRVGSLTTALFALRREDVVGLRGPFGRGFVAAPAEPTVFVAGGCGLSPLKRAIERHLAARPPGAPVAIVYGVASPADRIHRRALEAWRHGDGVRMFECSESAGAGWRGLRGSCVDHVAQAVAAIGARRAAVCGPPQMMARAAMELRRAGVAPDRIELAIERVMKCGTGHCGHCYVGPKYACRDGPVFTLAELDAVPQALENA
jgi:NAD(P)H-flavin reductase